jgi:hypothetical protein
MNWLDVMFCVNNFSANIKNTSLCCMLPSTHFNFKFKALLHSYIFLVPSKSVSTHNLFPYIFFCAKFFRKCFNVVDHTARWVLYCLNTVCVSLNPTWHFHVYHLSLMSCVSTEMSMGKFLAQEILSNVCYSDCKKPAIASNHP